MWSRNLFITFWLLVLVFLPRCGEDEAPSPPSSGAAVTVAGKNLYPPGFLRASVNPLGAVVLEWGDSNLEEEGYIVERRLPDTTSWAMVTTVSPNVTRTTDTRTQEKRTYFYRVLSFLQGVTVPSAEVRVTIPDLLPPNTVLLFFPPPRTRDRFAVFFFQANEATQNFVCTLDSQTLPCNSNPEACLKDSPLCIASAVVSGLSRGSHTFTVQAVDLVGRADPTPASYTWVVDDQPPVLTLTQKPADPTDYEAVNGVVTFEFSADKPVIFTCRKDNDPYFPCTSPVVLTYPRESNPIFTLTGEDEAGNRRSLTYSFRFDIAPPTLTLNNLPPEVVRPGDPVEIQFTAFDDTLPPSVFCQLDGGSLSSCTSPFTVSSDVEGSHTVTLVARDTFSKAFSHDILFTVDATPPEITFATTPGAVTSVSFLRYRFQVTNNDVVQGYFCQFQPLDLQAQPCLNPYDRFRVPPGNYTLTVTATDRVGNVSLPITHAVSVSYADFTTDPCRINGNFFKIIELMDTDTGDLSVPYEDRMCDVHTFYIHPTLQEKIAFRLDPPGGIPLASEDQDGIFDPSLDLVRSWSADYLNLPLSSGCGIIDSQTANTYTMVLPRESSDRGRFGYLVGAYKQQPPLQYLGVHDLLGFSPDTSAPHLLLRLHHPEADQFPYAGSTYTLRLLVDAWISPPPATFTVRVSDVTTDPNNPISLATFIAPWFTSIGSGHGNEVYDIPFSSPPCSGPNPPPPFVEIEGYVLGGYCGSSYPPPRGCLDRIRLPIACP